MRWLKTVIAGAMGCSFMLGCGASGDPKEPPASATPTGGTANSGTGGTTDPNSAGSSSTTTTGGVGTGGTSTGTATGGAEPVEPPPTVIDPIEYETSCDAEACAADEKCLECTFGTCCGKNCGFQLPCASGEVTYCDRQGGPIACAAP